MARIDLFAHFLHCTQEPLVASQINRIEALVVEQVAGDEGFHQVAKV